MKAASFTNLAARKSCNTAICRDPVAASGEVLVDVHAASVNAADWKFRDGQYHARPMLNSGHSGPGFFRRYQRRRDGVTDLKCGDAVFRRPRGGREGT